MCEPITIASMALTLASGAMSAYGQAQAGKAEQAAANYQAKQALNNAVLARVEARDALERGGQQEAQYARGLAQLRGRQQAAFASNNVLLGEGSPLRVLEDTAYLGSLDAATIRANAQREASGLTAQGQQSLAQAELLRLQGKAARQAGQMGAFKTILGSAASAGFAGYEAFGGGGIKPPAPYSNAAYNYFNPYGPR